MTFSLTDFWSSVFKLLDYTRQKGSILFLKYHILYSIFKCMVLVSEHRESHVVFYPVCVRVCVLTLGCCLGLFI